VGNWRQIHWLVQKTRAQEGAGGTESPSALLAGMTQTLILQDHTDFVLSSAKGSWADEVFADVTNRFAETFDPTDAVLAYSPRLVSPFVFFNAHAFVQQTGAHVWTVETNPLFYRHMITKCNTLGDKRVRYGWNPTFRAALRHWATKGHRFGALLSTELFLTTDESTLALLREVLSPGANVFSVEPAVSVAEFEEKCASTLRAHLELVSVSDVSTTLTRHLAECVQSRKQAFDSPNQQPCWLLVHARLL